MTLQQNISTPFLSLHKAAQSYLEQYRRGYLATTSSFLTWTSKNAGCISVPQNHATVQHSYCFTEPQPHLTRYLKINLLIRSAERYTYYFVTPVDSFALSYSPTRYSSRCMATATKTLQGQHQYPARLVYAEKSIKANATLIIKAARTFKADAACTTPTSNILTHLYDDTLCFASYLFSLYSWPPQQDYQQ